MGEWRSEGEAEQDTGMIDTFQIYQDLAETLDDAAARKLASVLGSIDRSTLFWGATLPREIQSANLFPSVFN